MKSKCTACGQTFRSLGGFDAHRVGRHGVDRRCLSVGELVEAGWKEGGIGWSMPGNGYWSARFVPSGEMGSEQGAAQPADPIRRDRLA